MPGVKKTMGEFKRGTLKSGSGKKVTSRKQAVAIAMSQEKKMAKAPKPMASNMVRRSNVSAAARKNSKPVPLGLAEKKAAAERKKEKARAMNKVKAQRGSASGRVGSAKSKGFARGKKTI